MARLSITSGTLNGTEYVLRLGTNRLGRNPDNDFHIPDPVVSGFHCEVLWQNDQVIVRDLGSTNGTFIDGQPIQEAVLRPGQVLGVGSVQLEVDTTVAEIVVPERTSLAQPPDRLEDGTLLCANHPELVAGMQCKACQRGFCRDCVHLVRRIGGRPLTLCPTCGGLCQPILRGAAAERRKKSFIGRLSETLVMKLKKTTQRAVGGPPDAPSA